MARITVQVDKHKLSSIITRLEGEKTFTNRAQLYREVAAAFNEPKITPAIIYLRVRAWAIPIKTPLGKRGRPGIVGGIRKVSRSKRFGADPILKESLQGLIGVTPEAHKNMARRVAKGSMRAAVSLKCLDCSGYVRVEVRECGCRECPLWVFRPYQNK
jgi:hypothetical protein